MSSASPGRFQSRLFNFVNRQALRLTEQCDRAIRHLKVTAVWGAQILIYPVYLLVQTGLSAGRQLSNSAQAGWPQLKQFSNKEPQNPAPSADTPIRRVLSEASSLPLSQNTTLVVSHPSVSAVVNIQQSVENIEIETTDQGQLTTDSVKHTSNQPCRVQGVASVLATRALVLVTVENQILDILTPQQQQRLATKISWEMADLLRQRRLAHSLETKAPRRLTQREKRHLFLPVRLFWQTMAWIQTSPVAIAANLFQESILVPSAASQQSQILVTTSVPQPKGILALLARRRELNQVVAETSQSAVAPSTSAEVSTDTPWVIAMLDRTVAELESHQLVPGSEAIIARYGSVTRALRQRTQKLLQPLQLIFIKPREPAASIEVSQTDTFQIQALIHAAIDYFFGRNRSNLSPTGSQERKAILANSQRELHQLSGHRSTALPPTTLPTNSAILDADETDPWLTWSDLYGNPDTSGLPQSQSQSPKPQSHAQLSEAFSSKMPVRHSNSIWGAIRHFLSPKQPIEKRTAPNAIELSEPSRLVVQTTKPKALEKRKSSVPTKHKTQSLSAADSRRNSISPATAATTAITTASSPSSDTSGIEPAPDWIETHVTSKGYVKHPLEQLLEWLDSAILRLEEFVVKVWQWLGQLGNRH